MFSREIVSIIENEYIKLAFLNDRKVFFCMKMTVLKCCGIKFTEAASNLKEILKRCRYETKYDVDPYIEGSACRC